MPSRREHQVIRAAGQKKMKHVIEIEALARRYAPQVLVKIATTGKSDSARVAAATAILDRAFGRPSQTLRSESGARASYFISDQPLRADEWEAKYCSEK
jgi:hypothetical protein